MRVPLVLALSVTGIVAGSASAADLPIHVAPGTWDDGGYARSLTIYQFEPGVTMRAYWRAPWHHHRYFPATGRRPRLGRLEILSAKRRRPPPAESYARAWSNIWAFPCECGPLSARDAVPPPVLNGRFQPAPEPPNS